MDTKKHENFGSVVAFNGDDIKASAAGFPVVSVRQGMTLISTTSINGVVSDIGKTSRTEEKTMAFIDALWSDRKIVITLCYGLEGADYTVVSGAGTDYPTIKTNETMHWAIRHPRIAEMNYNQWPPNWNDAQARKEFQKDNGKAPRSLIIGFVFDPANVK